MTTLTSPGLYISLVGRLSKAEQEENDSNSLHLLCYPSTRALHFTIKSYSNMQNRVARHNARTHSHKWTRKRRLSARHFAFFFSL